MTISSELQGDPLPDHEKSLYDVFYQNVINHPDVVALVSTKQSSTLYEIPSQPLASAKSEAEYLRWTYRDLNRAVQRFVTGLRAQGLKKGDLLVMFVPNTAEYVIATWAAYQIGCAYTPINPKGLSNAREMRHLLDVAMKGSQSDFMVVMSGSSDMCPPIEELTSDFNCVRILVDGERDGWTPFKELMQNQIPESQENLHQDHPSEHSDQTIFFTSGTTSLPKGCIMPSAYGFSAAQRWRQSDVPMKPGDRALFTLPNNHGFGWLCIIGPFLNGCTVVLPGPRFVPEDVIKAIQDEQVNHAGLVPTMLHALRNTSLANGRLTSLKRIVMGGSPPTDEVVKICIDILGASGVENLYGMTEGILVSSGVVHNVDGLIRDGDVSIGTPLPGMSVRVFTKDSNKLSRAGEPGEMHFSGPSLIDGYVGQADSNFYQDADGRPWFRTGDKAFIGSDNRLYLIGRYKDTIIRGGENIEPSAIEAILGRIPELSAFQPQIVRAPDDVAGEVPIVVVNQDVDNDTATKFKETILAEMGELYVPADVISVQTLGQEEYPKTMAGKVQKTKLETLVKEYCERQRTADISVIDGPISGPQVMQSLCAAIEKEKKLTIDPSRRMIELGIDSILSIAILKRVHFETGVSLPSSVFFTQATVGALCQQISAIEDTKDFLNFTPVMEDAPSDTCFSVLLQGTPKPGVPSLFMAPPGSGNAFVFRTLPKFFNDYAVYSFGSPFLMTKAESSWTIEETATIYTNTILSIDPVGPYMLCGWSMGTATAYETAYQLHERGKHVLGIIMLDLALARPMPDFPKATVDLFEMMGVFPPIRREGKPDVEIPAFRKKHRVAAYYAKMQYSPRPFEMQDAKRPKIFVIWAGHGDHDRMADSVREAMELEKKVGPGTKLKLSDAWLQDPRESFDAGGWDEMVGKDYVTWGIVEDADHDTLIESEELVPLTKGLMEETMDKWVREM